MINGKRSERLVASCGACNHHLGVPCHAHYYGLPVPVIREQCLDCGGVQGNCPCTVAEEGNEGRVLPDGIEWPLWDAS